MKSSRKNYYFPVVLFITLHVVQGGSYFWSVDHEIIKFGHSHESHLAIVYFPVVLFIMLVKVILTFESADEILKCDYSNESNRVILSCGAVYYAVQGDSNF